MFFTPNDITQFQMNKQFIDTAVVPLVSISLHESRSVHSSSAAQFLMAVTNFIEQQFKGRLLLTPPFTYFEQQEHTIDLTQIVTELKNAGFQHLFFVTCDKIWLNCEYNQQIIWIAPIPLESMDVSVKQRILQEQLNYIIPRFTESWSK